jgi:hypothetical protein
MDLSNYSADDALDEWVNDRTRGPLLLRHAVEISGPEYAIEGIVKRGFRKSVALGALKTAGLITIPKRERPVSDDPFRDQLTRLWQRDRERFMTLTEELYNAAVEE